MKRKQPPDIYSWHLYETISITRWFFSLIHWMFSKERYNSPPAPNFFYGHSGFPVSAFSILSNCTLGTLSIFWNLTLCVFLSVWYFEGIGAAESLQIQSSALRLETSRFFSGQNILDQPDQCETFQKLLLPKFSGVWVTRSGSYSVRLWSVLLNNLNPPPFRNINKSRESMEISKLNNK